MICYKKINKKWKTWSHEWSKLYFWKIPSVPKRSTPLWVDSLEKISLNWYKVHLLWKRKVQLKFWCFIYWVSSIRLKELNKTNFFHFLEVFILWATISLLAFCMNFSYEIFSCIHHKMTKIGSINKP